MNRRRAALLAILAPIGLVSVFFWLVNVERSAAIASGKKAVRLAAMSPSARRCGLSLAVANSMVFLDGTPGMMSIEFTTAGDGRITVIFEERAGPAFLPIGLSQQDFVARAVEYNPPPGEHSNPCSITVNAEGGSGRPSAGQHEEAVRVVTLPVDLRDVKRTQDAVADGHQPWRLDPRNVAIAALNAQGENLQLDSGLCHIGSIEGTSTTADCALCAGRARVVLEQPLGPGGIWVATRIEYCGR